MEHTALDADTATREELLRQIRDDLLSVTEAAACMAGHRLKTMQAAFPSRTAYNHDALYRSALVDLESRLPGWQGLSLERHFGAE